MSQYEKIIQTFKDLNISFDEISHEASTSCEHSAEIRKNAGLN